MTEKHKARPILIIFVAAFLAIIAVLYFSMNWVDQMRSSARGSARPSLATPDMYAPD